MVFFPDLHHVHQGAQLWCTQASDDRVKLREAVRAAVQSALTTKQREVVEAYFFEGMSQGQIAERLGVTQQVVQKRIYGARRGDRLVGGALQRLRVALAPLMSS